MARLSYNGISGYIVYKIIIFQIAVCRSLKLNKELPWAAMYLTAGVSLLAFEVYAFYIKSVARSFYSQLLLLWIPMRTKFPLCFLSAFFLMLFLIPFI